MFAKSAEYYDAIYTFKDYAKEAGEIAARLRSLRRDVETVLDVGCGTGEHARLLAETHGFAVDGLDLDPELVRLARRKHPGGRFFEADMSNFALGRRYHAILCLFGSIGYLVTLDRVASALVCFRQHLAPGGVVLIEPWFPPGGLDTGRTSRLSGTYRDTHVIRTSRTEVDGRVSRLHFEYEFHGPDGRHVATEVHELGLFTQEEMGRALESAGLSAAFEHTGLSGRGLWTATVAA